MLKTEVYAKMEFESHGHVAGAVIPAAPHKGTEAILLDIWSTVLTADCIGIHDDFLDLGGDSLAATRCINQIRELLGVELPLDAFFLDPAHIAGLAARIDRMRVGAS